MSKKIYDRKCLACGKEFQTDRKVQVYCCEKCCNNAGQRRRYHARPKEKKVCKNCGKEFTPTMELKAYCSVACQMKNGNAPRPKIKGVCPTCGEEFFGKKGKVFCSEKCRATLRKAEASGKPPEPKKRLKKGEKHLNEVIAQASAKGVSYGQFKALQYMQAHKYDKW